MQYLPMDACRHFVAKRGVRWAGGLLVALLSVLLVGLPKPTFAQNERVITVYHDGTEQTIVTDADTIGEALKRANVTLYDHDLVEPDANTKLVAPSYDINVYRARPITIADGPHLYQVMSAHTSARQIAADAGVKLYDEDTYIMSRIDDFVAEGGVGVKLTIDRATPVIFKLYGKEIPLRTQSKTVGELLKEKGVVLGDQDGTNLPAGTAITADMQVEVWRNGVQTVTQEEAIDFTIKQIRDADHEFGYLQVQTPGAKGKKQVTYQIEMKNGQEVSRKEIQSVVTAQPQEQVEIIGVKPKAGPADPAANQALGHQLMLGYGFGEEQWPCLLNLWNHESGWNQYKQNKGSGAYGIPQALPGSKMGAGWESDPAVQINWGLGYIRGRYGTPCGAWGVWQARGWY